jgi:L-rhamnose mutarotase
MKVQVKIAVLHPDRLLEYERLHQNIPEMNLRHMREGGYHTMRILRSEQTVIMVLEHDETRDIASLLEFSEAAELWQTRTAPCFATPWRDAHEIFSFHADHLMAGKA